MSPPRKRGLVHDTALHLLQKWDWYPKAASVQHLQGRAKKATSKGQQRYALAFALPLPACVSLTCAAPLT